MRGKQTAGKISYRLKKIGRYRGVRGLAGLALVVVIFGLGVGVGDGRFSRQPYSSVAGNLPSQLDYSSVNQVYQSLKANYDGTLTQSELLNGLKHGLANAPNDPYTVYFTPAEAKNFNSELNNSFSGIGAQLGKDAQGNLEIIAPISGLPADKAGLKAQDLIASINGKSTAGLSVDAAVDAIRGPAGSKVTLQVVRGGTQGLTFTITRNNIQVPSVTSKVLAGNIGYIQISTFADDTSSLIQTQAAKLKQENVKAVILDLRDNPGGLVNAAVAVSSEWLQPGQTIMNEKRGSTVVQSYTATDVNDLHGLPTVVLIDGGSASASEITAGALHDNHDAYVIGVKSYGKGVVQQIVNFGDGSELKVTIASWYRPNGQNINHKGITPDQTVTEPASATAANDPQLTAAEIYLNK